MPRPVFCIDKNRLCQKMKNYVKFILKNLLICFINITTSTISSTQSASDVRWVK